MRRLAFSLVVVAACAKTYGTTDDAPVDAGMDATLQVDAGDAYVPPPPLVDGGDAGTDGGSDMVTVSGGGRAFLIDRTEVTIAAFSDFSSTANPGFDQITGCAFKDKPGPLPGCVLLGGPSAPIACVDWCDAAAYCRFRGKRLCGAINGGAVVDPSNEADPTIAQWTRACTNSSLPGGYPYGPDPDLDACNTKGSAAGGAHSIDVASLSKCVGGVAGLYDMSGNVTEWVDSCGPGPMAPCLTQGGSYIMDPFTCSMTSAAGRATADPYLGFRCCKDLP